MRVELNRTSSTVQSSRALRFYEAALLAVPRYYSSPDPSALAFAVAVYCDYLTGVAGAEFNNNPGWLSPPNEAYPYFFVNNVSGRKFASFTTLAEGMDKLFRSIGQFPRAVELLQAGFVSFARWYSPQQMDQPVTGRASFDAYMTRVRQVGAVLSQPAFSAQDIATEWEAWQGRYVSDDAGVSTGDDESTDSADAGAGSGSGSARPGFAFSSTLGREVPNGHCVQSRRDRLWYRAVAGRWQLTQESDSACVERHPLSGGSGSGSGGSGSGGGEVGAATSSSSAGLLIVALGAGAVWFFAKR